jgi:hypothetical protein
MAGIFCLIFLLTLGWVYRLPGQLTWKGLEVVQPLILGITFGTTLLLVGLPEGFRARGELFVLLALSVDGLLVWRRARRIGHGLRVGVPTRSRWMTHRGGLLSLRLVLGVLLPVVAVLILRPGLALASLSAGILLDRGLFYGLAIRASTEAEMKKVEAVLRPGS